MDFLDIAKSRYTTKKYDPSRRVSDEDIDRLKEILRLSPSSINSQPWKFFFIADPALREKLAEVSNHNKNKVLRSSHLVVFTVMDDIDQFEEYVNTHLPDGAVGYYNMNIKPLSVAEKKAWMQHQVYISLGFFLSACASMGIDSTPMEGIQTAKYDEIIAPKGYKTLFAVTLGYRDAADENQLSITPKTRLKAEDVIETR